MAACRASSISVTIRGPSTDTSNSLPSFTNSHRYVAAANGSLTARALDIADVVKAVAVELDKTPGQVALAWTLRNPGVTSPILGVRTLAQLEDNLGALEVELPTEHLNELEAASRVELGFPHDFVNRP
jgi:aryl-alcohol dehydrogenase-like predicted oxidoreductase